MSQVYGQQFPAQWVQTVSPNLVPTLTLSLRQPSTEPKFFKHLMLILDVKAQSQWCHNTNGKFHNVAFKFSQVV